MTDLETAIERLENFLSHDPQEQREVMLELVRVRDAYINSLMQSEEQLPNLIDLLVGEDVVESREQVWAAIPLPELDDESARHYRRSGFHPETVRQLKLVERIRFVYTSLSSEKKLERNLEESELPNTVSLYQEYIDRLNALVRGYSERVDQIVKRKYWTDIYLQDLQEHGKRMIPSIIARLDSDLQGSNSREIVIKPFFEKAILYCVADYARSLRSIQRRSKSLDTQTFDVAEEQPQFLDERRVTPEDIDRLMKPLTRDERRLIETAFYPILEGNNPLSVREAGRQLDLTHGTAIRRYNSARTKIVLGSLQHGIGDYLIGPETIKQILK